MGSCMVTVNSKEELDQLRSEHPMAVTMVRSDNCGHCREIHPLIEKRCKDVEGVIPVIDCPVDKQFCIDELRGLKKEGIPLIIGTERSNIKKPVFVIEGADTKQVNHNFDIMKQLVNDARKKGGESREQQRPSPARHDDGDHGIPMGPPPPPRVQGNRQSTDDMVNAVLGFSPSRRPVEPVMMCTPGYDCNDADYNDRAIQFLLSRKEGRYF